MPFAALGLIPELTRALADRGYSAPTPVQSRVIPPVLARRDILAGSQTGTGKTAGFTLPLLQLLQADTRRSNAPRALILVPTRELAAQVADSVNSYGKYLKLRTAMIFGGVSINPQIDTLRRGVDILVATPGRLLDHAQQRTVDLSQVQIFVLDEADRMLDMGFIADIRRVIKLLPAKRQNLMFSATYSEDIRRLAQSFLHDPAEVEVARRNTAVDTVEQRVYRIAKDQKRALLSHLITDGNWDQVLVFTRTKHGANRLAKQLEQDGITAAAIHGNKSQNARTQALSAFKELKIRALVATEVASRGLDIKELPFVVNYELPNVPEDYVHRIGRTGRAGASGVAVSLVSSDENDLLKDIERLMRKSIPEAAVPVFKAAPPPLPSEARAPRADGRQQQGQRGQRARGANGRTPDGRTNDSRANNSGVRRVPSGAGFFAARGQSAQPDPRRAARTSDDSAGRAPRDGRQGQTQGSGRPHSAHNQAQNKSPHSQPGGRGPSRSNRRGGPQRGSNNFRGRTRP
jgi:ATP-dependent RNA helicase RhlE